MSIDNNSDRPQKKSTLFKDIIRICLYIMLAPLLLLFAGPILLMAAILGQISLGRLQLRPNKYYRSGRLWAFVVGIIICGLSWGGLVWLWQNATFSNSLNAYAAPFLDRVGIVSPSINKPDPLAMLTTTPLPTETQVLKNTSTLDKTNVVTPTSTLLPVTTTQISQTATATALPLPANSATPSVTSVHTPTPSTTPTITSTPTEIPVISISTTLISSTQGISSTAYVTNTTRLALTPQQTLDTANRLLITYIKNSANADTVPLTDFWADDALQDVEKFAAQIKAKYQNPVTITYQILTLIPGVTISNTAILTTTLESQELWQYEDTEQQKNSLSDYVYTLTNTGDGWKIIDYQFKVLSSALTPVLVTNTTAITSE